MRQGSKQRDCIENYLRETRSHPTAQEIYAHTRAKFPDVSLGTVYRNLDRLIAENAVKKVQMTGAADRYDYVREKHNHALCSECGKLFDFCYSLDVDAVQSAIGGDISIKDADFLVVGVCAECAKRGTDKAGRGRAEKTDK
ncbi:MAG: transcriptional repressor [Clostridiales bacterium]|nr:transcriptional repressor [Clostridiales bacterium]